MKSKTRRILLSFGVVVFTNFACSKTPDEKTLIIDKESSPDKGVVGIGLAPETQELYGDDDRSIVLLNPTQSTVGNGGDVVVCSRDGNQISVTMLDYYELENRWLLTLDRTAEEQSMDDILDQVISQLAQLDPSRAQFYREELEFFNKNVNYWKGLKLNNIHDSNHIGVESGCKIIQIARQQKPTLSRDKYYIVVSDLFDLMDNYNKAGLILHEIIYKEAIKYGHKDSTRARFFNALISSTALANYSLPEYIEILVEVGFEDFTLGGVMIAPETFRTVGAPDAEWTAQTKKEQEIRINNFDLDIKTGLVTFGKDNRPIYIESASGNQLCPLDEAQDFNITLGYDGASTIFGNRDGLNFCFQSSLYNARYDLPAQIVEIHPESHTIQVVATGDVGTSIPVYGDEHIDICPQSEVTLEEVADKDRTWVREARVCNTGVNLTTETGEMITTQGSQQFEFNQEGKVILP